VKIVFLSLGIAKKPQSVYWNELDKQRLLTNGLSVHYLQIVIC